MLQNGTMLALLERGEARRRDRRAFLKQAGAAAGAGAGLAMLSACGDDGKYQTPVPTPTPTALTDADVLNFALNLEYLEATFYSYAAFGTPLAATSLTGTGTQGATTGGRQVQFSDPVVAQYAREIAGDEAAHVAFLRSQLMGSAVAIPAINIDGGDSGAFTAAARAAGVIASNATFDPYASDQNFLLAAFIFEDVGVTAYKGASPLINNKTYLEAAAGILAVEAYHAGLIRSTLYAKGIDATNPQPDLITGANKISAARDSLDGSTTLDQGIQVNNTANMTPLDNDGIAFSRSAGQTLNIVYLNKAMATSGGFFPAGVNGTINASAASG